MGFWNNPKKQNTLFWAIVAIIVIAIILWIR